jgi:hypothetical protein
MDFKTNPDIFSSFGSTILVSDSFGRGDGRFLQNNPIVHEPQNYSMRNQRLVVIFRPDNLGDQI